MKKTLNSYLAALIGFSLLVSYNVKALAEDQTLDDQDIINVENLYNKPAVKTKTELPKENNRFENKSSAEVSSDSANTADANKKNEVQESIKDEKIERLTDLNKLSPFREVSVIQKKYLPKTERFQFFAGAGTTTNSPWFLNLGLKVNLGYYFTETLGIELSGLFLSNSERQVSKEIRDNNNLQPEQFVYTKSHMGGDLVWAPIYGKVTYLNDRIVPFDMYFSAGLGSSTTNSQEGTNMTYHIGTGQIFAISKSTAFRWDYSWHYFEATPTNTTGVAGQKNSYNDLILTAGVSFFFPEVSNR